MGGYLEKRIIENKVLAEAEKGCAATNYCHLMIFQQGMSTTNPPFQCIIAQKFHRSSHPVKRASPVWIPPSITPSTTIAPLIASG